MNANETTHIALTKPQLRKFGLMLSGILMGLFGFAFPLLLGAKIATWPWVLGIIVFIPTICMPGSLKLIYTPWMKFGHVMGWINTRIILGIIYFTVITPIGILMRLFGKDTMHTRYDDTLKSYRKIAEQRTIKHMEKPF